MNLTEMLLFCSFLVSFAGLIIQICNPLRLFEAPGWFKSGSAGGLWPCQSPIFTQKREVTATSQKLQLLLNENL